MKINKRDLILDYIIESYLRTNLPIGSAELGLQMQELIPASTIRVYFKKLSDEGEIRQLHVSGGRIPTTKAMRTYWQNKLNLSSKIFLENSDKISLVASEFEIYTMVFTCENETFCELINHKNRFMILVFNSEEIVIKFDERAFKFLHNLLGLSLSELEKTAMQVGLSELRAKIRELKRSKIVFLANEIVAYKIFNDNRAKMLLDPEISLRFNKNIIFLPFFNEGFMGIKRDVTYNGKEATMLCAGSIYEDFDKFFNFLTEVA